MDFWDLIPFLIGAIYLFGRGKKKDVGVPGEQSPQPKRPEMSLEDIWKQLSGEPIEEKRATPVVEEVAPERMRTAKKKEKVLATELDNRRSKNKSKYDRHYVENIEKYDDPIQHTTRDALHHPYERHIALEGDKLNADDISLRQAIIYDAILNRPKY